MPGDAVAIAPNLYKVVLENNIAGNQDAHALLVELK